MDKLIEISVSPLLMSVLTGVPVGALIETAMPWLFAGFVVWLAFKYGK
jgi:hypothetical protein